MIFFFLLFFLDTCFLLPAAENSPRGAAGREGSVAGVGTVGVWATSPCDPLSLPGPAQPGSRVPLPSGDGVSAAVPTHLHAHCVR